jgi:nucleotide-binding universal stress UspA family protein
MAARMAHREQARVVAVHVRQATEAALGAMDAAGMLDTSAIYDAAGEVALEAKESATRVLGGAGLRSWTYEERTGSRSDSLVAAIAEHEGDLVVVGSHGHGPLYDLLVGSTAQGLLKEAPVSVLVARPSPSAGTA